MSEGIIIALITAIGSLLGGVIGQIITASATVKAAAIKEKVNLPTSSKEEQPRSWGRMIGGALIGAIATLIILSLLGIFPPDKQNPPTATENPSSTPNTADSNNSLPKLSQADYGNLLYEDTFESDTGVWSLQSGNSIQNGELILSPATSTFPNWSTQYSDFIFETEFRFIDPQSTHYFTAYLRYSDCSAGNCSTQVFVSSASEVAAWHIGSDKKQLMNYTNAPQLDPKASNTLTVIVKGSEFKVYINRVFVRSFTDSAYKSGKVVLDADESPTAVSYIRFYSLP